VAYKIPQFLAQNLRHHPGSELGALEVEFGWMQNLIVPNFKKNYLNPSLYAKVMTVLPKHVRVTILEGGIWLGIEIG
jgi:hypothetical protein